jgi:hypothetical protein
MITGSARSSGVAVEVYPGGALASISLSPQAIRLGPADLAATILGAVTQASAVASQRVRALGLESRELAILGLDCPPELAERAESTTPDSWSLS